MSKDDLGGKNIAPGLVVHSAAKAASRAKAPPEMLAELHALVDERDLQSVLDHKLEVYEFPTDPDKLTEQQVEILINMLRIEDYTPKE